MLSETYLGNVKKKKEEYPDALFIEITRNRNHVLSPSRDLLNDYKKHYNWDAYVERFLKEMQDVKCQIEMQKIAIRAIKGDVFLVCFEKEGNCHRFLVKEMIKEKMKVLENE